MCSVEGCLKKPRSLGLCSTHYNQQYDADRCKEKRQYHFNNQDRILKRMRKYRREHLAEDAARTAKRRANKLRATPAWLTKEQYDQIEQIYINRPAGYEIDHIIPLQGLTVCGLHVPWNLQCIPEYENRSKSNKHET